MPQFPNFPAGQIYDYGRDGSDFSIRNGSGTVVTQLTATQSDALQRLNSDVNVVAYNATSDKVVLLFPQPRTITGIYAVSYDAGGSFYLQYSSDTTNGIDGTWQTALTANHATLLLPQLRQNNIFSGVLSNVTGLRTATSASGTQYLRSLVLWTTDDIGGLRLWHPTLNQPFSNDELLMDRGDIFVNAAGVTQQFRIKNTHATQTANNVVVSSPAGNGAGSLQSEVTFSLDDVSYGSSSTITSIAPGAISGIVYMNRPLITDAAGTSRWAFIGCEVTSWS